MHSTSPEGFPAPPEAKASDLSIIIVSFNTRDLLWKCISSVLANRSGISCEVYVVDNASCDGSPAMVREKFPEVKLEENRENVGFARANSQVLSKISSRYALLLNSDTEIPPGSDALASMVAYLDAHPKIGALGPKILFPDGTIQLHCARSFPTLWTDFCHLTYLAHRFPGNRLTGKYLMSYWDHQSLREVEVLLGACMMVRKEVIDSVGVLDPQFFLGGEDADWCFRIKNAGWKVVYYPEAWITHHGGASKALMPVHESKETHIAYYKYFRKHHGPVYAFAGRLMTALIMSLYICFYGLRFALFPSRRDPLREAIRMRRDILAWCLTGK